MGQCDMQSAAAHIWRDSRNPEAQGFKARILAAARAHAATMQAADATVLCGPECPEAREFGRRGVAHVHTLGELYRAVEAGRYEMELVLRNREADRPDVPALLARMGANRAHVERLARARLEPLQEREPLQATRYWWDEGRQAWPWLALLGEADAGKTLAATTCLWRFAAAYPWNSRPSGGAQRKPAVFVRVQSLSRMAAWDEQHDDLRGCEVLVLDDFGAENLRPEAEAMLTELLDVRYGRGALTVLTSQLNVADFRARFDRAGGEDATPGRLWRRVKERALVLEGDVLWAGDAAVPEAEWKRGRR